MNRKRETAELTVAVWAAGVHSARVIAELLGMSERYVRKLLAEAGLLERRKITHGVAMLRLGPELSRRVVQFRMGDDRTRRRGQ
ncbi:MAG: hypothetical protein ACREYB_05190 [Casimicrobiaceae bacterium]